MTRKRVMGGLIAPPRRTVVEHRIGDLRWRRESPEQNYFLCECGWRADGPEANLEYEAHRRSSRGAA